MIGERPQPAAEIRSSAGVRASLLEYLHGCPICRHTGLRHYCRVPSRFNPGEFIRYERCEGCGAVFRNPRLPEEYRLARYETGHHDETGRRLDPKSQVHYGYMMRRIRGLAPRLGKARLLDFGCGAGGFLVEARAAGFEVMGLELNREMARHVREAHGIPVHDGLADDARFRGERFDVILSSQVFEHLLDPRDTLRILRDRLNPGGLLLIEVPNLRDIRERLRRGSTMDDSHLFYFSRHSLGRLLAEGGFRVRRTEEGLRPFRILGERARGLPLSLLAAAERSASLLQVKTVLSVIAERL